MEIIVLSIHLLVCVCLIGLVLLQRSEGGALGIGGGGGSSSLMSGRGAADALAKMTSVAGGFFLVTSLSLTVLSGAASDSNAGSVLDNLVPGASAPATTTPPEQVPAEPETDRPDPTESSAPQAADTRLASFGPSEAAAAPNPPAASAATTRAGPIENRPTTTAASQPPASQPQRATTTQTSATQQPPAATTTQRSTSATTQPQEASQPVATNNSGAVSGITLTDDEPAGPESVEVGNGLEAVRRERAGPDQ